MSGYIIASVILGLSKNAETCLGIMCWRWAFLVEVFLLLPLCVMVNFVPREHLSIRIVHGKSEKKKRYQQVFTLLSFRADLNYI